MAAVGTGTVVIVVAEIGGVMAAKVGFETSWWQLCWTVQMEPWELST